MKRLLVPRLAILTALLPLAACDTPSEERERPRERPAPSGQHPIPEDEIDRGVAEPRTEPRDREPDSAPKPPPPTAPVGNYEYGKPVPGKPGFVTSPYAPYQGYVDVRGFPPGTEVKDPYTGKIFLVPAQ